MRLTVSLEPAAELRMEPLTLTRALGDCYVAGRTWRELQRQACAEAGLELLETGGAFRLKENAWVPGSALRSWLASDPSNLLCGDTLVAYPESGAGKEIKLGPEALVIRYPWDFLNLQEMLLAQETQSRVHPTAHLHERATVDGVLLLGEDSVILPGVYIEGVAVIGRACKIGPNAYLRGMTMIGDGCHIGQAVEVKNSILYPQAALGHLSYCGDSIVGQGVNFGAGTIVSNFRHDGKNHRSMVGNHLVDTGRRKFGSVIGDGVHTGIHTSIYPGRKLWPRTTTRPGDTVQQDLVLN